MLRCEYFTDALGTKFPKRVCSNEIRLLVDKPSRSVNLLYPQVFTSEERQSRLADLKAISAEIENISSFIDSQVLGKPLSNQIIYKIGSLLEEILNSNRVLSKLINQDYKVTYWVQE